MRHRKEKNINQHINSKLQRSSYQKKGKKKEEEEEIEKRKSDICAMFAKRVKGK